MDDAERELIHRNGSKDDPYFPDPAQDLATLDEGLIVTPPKGQEVGYVPVCAHQQLAGEKLPEFQSVKR